MNEFLSKLQSSSMARSFALGLSGVVGTYLLQWLSTADFGPTWTPLLAGLLPVVVNWARMQIPSPPAPDVPKPDPLGPLSQEQLQALAGDHDDDKPDLIPFVLPLLLALLFTSAAQAAAPKAVINGPTNAVPGELIVLDASQSEGEPTHYSWRISPEIKGRKQIGPLDGGRKLQMASFPGRYLITLVCSNADGNDVLAWQVDVPGTPPCPAPDPQPVTPQPIPVDPAPPRPPAPDPNPAPTPPAPVPPQPVPPTPPAPTPPDPAPSRFGIRDRVRTAILGISSPTRAAEVAQLRGKLQVLQQQAQAGQLTQQQILDGMVAELKALPPSWALIKTLASLGIKFLINGGQLKTVEDWIDLVAEVIDSLTGL